MRAIADVLIVEHGKKMPDAAAQIAATAQAKANPERIEKLAGASAKQDEILTDLRGLLDQMQKWAETGKTCCV